MSGIVLATVVSVGTTAYGSHQAKKAAKNAPGMPDYQEDPDYREMQDYLKKFGMDTLSGEIDPYYKSIGESGGAEFENMMALNRRDITQSTTEALAKGGRARGGQLAASTATAISDADIKARYQDYQRSLQGKQFLMKEGTGAINTALNSYGNNEVNANNYNMLEYEDATTKHNAETAREQAEIQAYGEAIGYGLGQIGKAGTATKKNTTSNRTINWSSGGIDTSRFR